MEQVEERTALEEQIAEVKAAAGQRPDAFYERQRAWEESAGASAEWFTLHPLAISATSGATFETDPDGTIHVTGKRAKTDSYTITLPASERDITALRIDAPPQAGRNQNFVINDIELSINSGEGVAQNGRFVRIELAGKGKMLQLAEVEVISEGKNVASGGTAKQSSTGFGGLPQFAIDGNPDGDFAKKSVSHTSVEDNPWWELDLGSAKPIQRLAIYSRTDGDLFSRHDGFRIRILDQEHKAVWEQTIPKAMAKHELAIDGSGSVDLKNASATFAQEKFPAALAIDGDASKDSGWAVAPKLDRCAHALAFELDRAAGGSESLTLTLHQNYPKLALGHFRISATAAPDPQALLPAAVASALAVAPGARSPEQAAAISDHYASLDPWTEKQVSKLAELEKQLASLKPVTTPIMRELPSDRRRKTQLMVKGNYLQPGKEVTPGVPAAFHPLTPSKRGAIDRLALAEWITSPENPLTARVAANRFWAKLFGTGLVETEEDFGTQGTFPSHPQLLDWLALHFRDGLDWDTKAFLKTIVMSATYRQSNKINDQHLELDPKNRLLARGPRVRLEAEMVRDQALSASGLLSDKMFGPSVFPPQPAGLWQAAFNGQRTWKTSEGEDRYRRGVYTFLRRSVPYPSMITFDAPNREICTVRRIRTNTPLQAFVTLNDPAYVELAQALARRIVMQGGDDLESRIRFGLKLCLLRDPAGSQIDSIRRPLPERARTLLRSRQRKRSRSPQTRSGRYRKISRPVRRRPRPGQSSPMSCSIWMR